MLQLRSAVSWAGVATGQIETDSGISALDSLALGVLIHRTSLHGGLR
jgi:hypothetical protein